ncbi:MAG: hypothetical protein RLZZ352_1071 [Pseudomonadota bacterium]|jgi:energy-coupling factor transporter ATP-binding protein EcfA2
MAQLRIKNFGPIVQGMQNNEGWLTFKRVTVFIGNQGSGKSTLAKLFSTFSWMEKALVRGDYDQKWFERKDRFKNQLLPYHRLEHYLQAQGTEIEYRGNAYAFSYKEGYLQIQRQDHEAHQLSLQQPEGELYQLPQVMYVPAERNFIAYVRHPRELRFGVCDDQTGQTAYVDTFVGNADHWIATVENKNQVPVTFTAIDKCVIQDKPSTPEEPTP